MSQRALHVHFPSLLPVVPTVDLGALPTPVMSLAALRDRLGPRVPELWVKRDDQAGTLYGGNKVRKLEHLLGEAPGRPAAGSPRRLIAYGTYGSNYTLATGLFGRALGYEVAAVLYPQPLTALFERLLTKEPQRRPRADLLMQSLKSIKDGSPPPKLPEVFVDPYAATGRLDEAVRTAVISQAAMERRAPTLQPPKRRRTAVRAGMDLAAPRALPTRAQVRPGQTLPGPVSAQVAVAARGRRHPGLMPSLAEITAAAVVAHQPKIPGQEAQSAGLAFKASLLWNTTSPLQACRGGETQSELKS